MKKRDINTDLSSVQHRLLNGVNKIADAVVTTLGPKGKNVAIQNLSGPGMRITKDGVTVAKSIILEDEQEELGASLVREVSLRSNEEVGDGTTTSVVVARSLFVEGIKFLDAHPTIEVSHLVDTIKDNAKTAEKYIKDNLVRTISTPDEIELLAYTSANGDEVVATAVRKAYEEVGNKGVVLVEESKKPSIDFKKVDGSTTSWGFAAPGFMTAPERGVAELENVIALLFKGKVNTLQPILQFLEKAVEAQNGVLLIAEDFDASVLSTLFLNKQQGNLSVCCVSHRGDTEDVDDIAAILGLKAIDPAFAPVVNSTNLGGCRFVKVTKDELSIVDGRMEAEAVEARKKYFQHHIEESKDPEEKAGYETRFARLYGGIGILSVGAETVAQGRELKDRVDDAVSAVRSALKHGVTPGCGNALYSASEFINGGVRTTDDYKVDMYEPFIKALREPRSLLLGDKSIGHDAWQGTDIRTGMTGDLFELGVYDSAMATIMAIRNAAEIGTLLLNTGCLITNAKDKKDVVG